MTLSRLNSHFPKNHLFTYNKPVVTIGSRIIARNKIKVLKVAIAECLRKLLTIVKTMIQKNTLECKLHFQHLIFNTVAPGHEGNS